MRILACLGFALVATTANAQSVTTTVNPETHAATTRDSEHPASGKVQAAHTTNPTIPPTTAHGGGTINRWATTVTGHPSNNFAAMTTAS